MRYNVLASSSKGNCIIIEDKIMLDCGVSYRTIKPYLKDLKLIFISHLHTDHLNKVCIRQTAYNYPTKKYICGNKEVVNELVKNGVKKENIFLLDNNKWYDLGICKCRVEPTTHDVMNNLLKLEYNNEKLIYIVDTANVDNIEAKDYNYFFIEQNYDESTLEKHINEAIEENDDNKLYYLRRVPYTHLSKQQAIDFLIENMGNSAVYIPIHKSKYNFKEDENER